LKPYQPNQRIITPSTNRLLLWPGKVFTCACGSFSLLRSQQAAVNKPLFLWWSHAQEHSLHESSWL
jgi:hypothetical protein